MEANAASAEGEGDATGADAEFKGRATTSRQVGEEVHCRINDVRLEQLGPQRPVALGDPFIEV